MEVQAAGDEFVMPEGLTPAQQQQYVRQAIANAKAIQRRTDEDILEEAKEAKREAVEAKREAARLRYAFMLQHRCKTVYRNLCPNYSC